MDTVTLALAKKYVKESLLGGGAIVGKNVTISSIVPIEGGNKITFSYTLDNGITKSSTLDVMDGVNGADGVDGVGISKVEKIKTEGLVDTYRMSFTDGTSFDFQIINGSDGSGGEANVQSDWNETDATSDAYIKNKPTIPSIEGLATTEYVDNAINNIPETDLSDYYTKSETYSKTEVNTLIPTVPTKVSELENDSNYISSVPEEYITETELTAKGYLTEHQDLSEYAKTADVVAKETGKSLVSDTDIAQITTNKSAIETLNGTGEGSVDKKVANEIAKVVSDAPEDFDTLKEVADWISNDTSGAAKMQNDIATLNGDDTKDGSVQKQIKDSLVDYAKITDIPTSLPANGGNADTISGCGINNIVHSSSAINPFNIDTQGGNWVADIVTEWSSFRGTLPEGVRMWAQVMQTACNDFFTQTLRDMDNAMWARFKHINDDKWRKWVPIYTGATFNPANDNLLINPNFRINQRGKTEYHAMGYTVDRWYIQSSNEYNLNINSHGISVSKTAGFTNLIQAIDLNDYTFLYGQTVTLSAKVYNISGDVAIRAIQGTNVTDTSALDRRTDAANGHITFTIANDTSKNILGCMICMDKYEQASCNVEWVKLEIGDAATPFIPPEPATELLKCQRYFQAIGQYLLFAYPIGNGTNEYAVDKSEVVNPMRTGFTVQTESINGADNKYSIYSGASWDDYDITPGSREIACISTNTIRFFFNLIDLSKVIAFKHIYLDAEIY